MTTVVPETFTMVLYDHDTIVNTVDEVLATIDFPTNEDVRVEVDERNPLARSRLVSWEPVVMEIDGGAFEDPRHPRQLSSDLVAVVVGRLALQALDRRDPGFGAPEAAELSAAHRVAWDVYALGRLAHRGYPCQRARRLYSFRNRHGFSDVADAAFDRLWSTPHLDWDEIVAISDAAAARPEPDSAA